MVYAEVIVGNGVVLGPVEIVKKEATLDASCSVGSFFVVEAGTVLAHSSCNKFELNTEAQTIKSPCLDEVAVI